MSTTYSDGLYSTVKEAHAAAFGDWLSAGNGLSAAIEQAVAAGDTAEALADECIADGWFERYDWLDRGTLVAVAAETLNAAP